MHPRVGIAVFIFNSTGHLVLGQRKGSHGAGTTTTTSSRVTQLTVSARNVGPPGGHLEYGESFEACASREDVEETGLAVTDLRFLTATNRVMVDEGKHYVTVFVGGRLLEPEKCAGLEWVSWDDVKHYSDENHSRKLFQPILDLLKQHPGFDPYAGYSRG